MVKDKNKKGYPKRVALQIVRVAFISYLELNSIQIQLLI